MTHVHIHAPSATAKSIRAGNCPDCKKRTRFIGFFTPWYGWRTTCMRCGREWNDGEWGALDFVRGIRRRNIAHAKNTWRRMPPVSQNHYGIEQ
jgi:hypothetical protein